MDDYISKPVNAERLAEVVRRWVPDRANPDPDPAPAPVPGATAPDPLDGLDPSLLGGLRDLGKDAGPDLLASLVGMFLEDAGTRIAELREAAAAADCLRLAGISHTLKGSAGNLAACRLAASAATLEDRARNGSVEGAVALVEQLDQELQRLRLVLPAALGVAAALVGGGPAPADGFRR